MQRFHFVIEQRQADRVVGMLGRKDVEHVAVHAEGSTAKLHFVALVLHFGQALDGVALAQAVTLVEVQDHAVVLGWIADAVDRRDRGDDDAVRSLEDRLGRRQAHLLDVLVDRRILLDVQVARGNIRLGLVVVVVETKYSIEFLGKNSRNSE